MNHTQRLRGNLEKHLQFAMAPRTRFPTLIQNCFISQTLFRQDRHLFTRSTCFNERLNPVHLDNQINPRLRKWSKLVWTSIVPVYPLSYRTLAPPNRASLASVRGELKLDGSTDRHDGSNRLGLTRYSSNHLDASRVQGTGSTDQGPSTWKAEISGRGMEVRSFCEASTSCNKCSTG